MTQRIWTFLQSQPAFDPEATFYNVVRNGSGAAFDAHHVVLADAFGDRISFTGDFVINGGKLIGGTVTGFDVFTGSTKVMHAAGYNVSYVTLATDITAYQANQADPGL